MVFRPDRLRGVLNNRHTKFSSDGIDAIHVRHLAKEVDRHDGLDLRTMRTGECITHSLNIDVVGNRIDINEDRPSPNLMNTTCSGEEGVRPDDDCIPPTHTKCLQRNHDRIGTTGTTNRMRQLSNTLHILLQSR